VVFFRAFFDRCRRRRQWWRELDVTARKHMTASCGPDTHAGLRDEARDVASDPLMTPRQQMTASCGPDTHAGLRDEAQAVASDMDPAMAATRGSVAPSWFGSWQDEDGVPLVLALAMPHAGHELLLTLASTSRALRCRAASLVDSRLCALSFADSRGRVEYPREPESCAYRPLHYHDSLLALCEDAQMQLAAGLAAVDADVATLERGLGVLTALAPDVDADSLANLATLSLGSPPNLDAAQKAQLVESLGVAARWEIPEACLVSRLRDQAHVVRGATAIKANLRALLAKRRDVSPTLPQRCLAAFQPAVARALPLGWRPEIAGAIVKIAAQRPGVKIGTLLRTLLACAQRDDGGAAAANGSGGGDRGGEVAGGGGDGGGARGGEGGTPGGLLGGSEGGDGTGGGGAGGGDRGTPGASMLPSMLPAMSPAFSPSVFAGYDSSSAGSSLFRATEASFRCSSPLPPFCPHSPALGPTGQRQVSQPELTLRGLQRVSKLVLQFVKHGGDTPGSSSSFSTPLLGPLPLNIAPAGVPWSPAPSPGGGAGLLHARPGFEALRTGAVGSALAARCEARIQRGSAAGAAARDRGVMLPPMRPGGGLPLPAPRPGGVRRAAGPSQLAPVAKSARSVVLSAFGASSSACRAREECAAEAVAAVPPIGVRG